MVKVCELGFLNALRDVKVLRMIMDLKKKWKAKGNCKWISCYLKKVGKSMVKHNEPMCNEGQNVYEYDSMMR